MHVLLTTIVSTKLSRHMKARRAYTSGANVLPADEMRRALLGCVRWELVIAKRNDFDGPVAEIRERKPLQW